MNSIDSELNDEIIHDLKESVVEGERIRILNDTRKRLEKFLVEDKEFFRNGLSSGLPVNIRPLKVDLSINSMPANAKLQNYSQEQREFSSEFVKDLATSRDGLSKSKMGLGQCSSDCEKSILQFSVDFNRSTNKLFYISIRCRI